MVLLLSDVFGGGAPVDHVIVGLEDDRIEPRRVEVTDAYLVPRRGELPRIGLQDGMIEACRVGVCIDDKMVHTAPPSLTSCS